MKSSIGVMFGLIVVCFLSVAWLLNAKSELAAQNELLNNRVDSLSSELKVVKKRASALDRKIVDIESKLMPRFQEINR